MILPSWLARNIALDIYRFDRGVPLMLGIIFVKVI